MRLLALPAAAILSFITSADAQDSIRQQSLDFGGLPSVTRPVDKSYPVSGPARIFVSNRYGVVRIVPWSDRVVRVQAQIRVGADTAEHAEEFAQAIDVFGAHVGDGIDIRTRYPEADPQRKIGFGTDLEVSVPSDSSIEIENAFGDVFVSGITGAVSIDARFGEIGLRDLAGAVRVQARGQFKLVANKLTGGGTFFLRNTDAEFIDVEGDIHIDNYLGSVTLRPGDAPVNLNVSCESGSIDLHLENGPLPDLIATAESGEIETPIAFETEIWGETVTHRHQDPDAEQHIDLFTSFAPIRIHQAALTAAAEPLVAPVGAPITDTIERDYDLLPGTVLRLNLMEGDVTIEGHDGPRVEVSAARFVRVTNVASARLALEGLVLRADFSPEYLGVTTAVQDDMESLGCTEYRMNLTIRLPRGAPVQLRRKNGGTKISNLVADLSIEQEEGSVTLQNIQGNVKISLNKGPIATQDTAGTLELAAGAGDIDVRQPFGDVRVQCTGGNTVIDSPGAGVFGRTLDGDVRLIALAGVKADYDIATENGNISLAVPDTADAVFLLNVYGGSVKSSVPVTGTIDRDVQSFQGRLNAGSRRILLEARDGNIVID